MAKTRTKSPLSERRTAPKTDAEIEHVRFMIRAHVIHQAALAKLNDHLLLSLLFEMCCEIVGEIQDEHRRAKVISKLHQAMVDVDRMKVGKRRGGWLPKWGKKGSCK